MYAIAMHLAFKSHISLFHLIGVRALAAAIRVVESWQTFTELHHVFVFVFFVGYIVELIVGKLDVRVEK